MEDGTLELATFNVITRMGISKNILPVLEQFVTVQGEGLNVGKPYYFIRVGGCPLRCNFCDSEYSWVPKSDSIMKVADVVNRAITVCARNNIEWVSITGGEPMLYVPQLIDIIEGLHEHHIKVHIETSGRFYDEKVHMMCDLYSPDAKTPCTGEQMDGYFKGIENMRSCDQVKCLISDYNDLSYAYSVNKAVNGRCTMVLQPFNTNILTEATKNMSEVMRNSRPLEPIQKNLLRSNLCNGLRWLIEAYQRSTESGDLWKKVIITPQIHVLAFGNEPSR